MFNTFDKDGDGTIDAEEFGAALQSLQQQLSGKEIEEIIKIVHQMKRCFRRNSP